MTTASHISLNQDMVARASQHLAVSLKQSDADAAALCTLDGQVVWASDQAFERAALNIARIGIASLRLWAKSRRGRLEQIGLVTQEGMVNLIFVPPIGSLLVVSSNGHGGWPEDEPAQLLQALGFTH